MSRRTVSILVAIVLLGLVLRFAVGMVENREVDKRGAPRVRGNQVYVEAADNLLAGSGYHWLWYLGLGERFANRPPGYAIYLAGIRGTFGTAPWVLILIQSLVGALTAVPVFLFSRRYLGDAAGLVAAALVSVYPYYVTNDSTVNESCLYVHLMVWCVYFAHRTAERSGIRAGLTTGVLAGLAGMVRVTWLVSLPFLFAWTFFASRRRMRAALLVLVAGAAAVLVCLPWGLRNQKRFGKFAMAIDTGRALWNGHNAHTLEFYPGKSIDESERKAWAMLTPEQREALQREPDESVTDAMFMEMALLNIRADPSAAIRRGFVKLGAQFSPVFNPGPVGALKQAGHAVPYCGALLLAVVGVWITRHRWRDHLLGLLLIAGAAIPAAVFWGQTRFRTPTDWFLLVAAAPALVALGRWASSIKASRRG